MSCKKCIAIRTLLFPNFKSHKKNINSCPLWCDTFMIKILYIYIYTDINFHTQNVRISRIHCCNLKTYQINHCLYIWLIWTKTDVQLNCLHVQNCIHFSRGRCNSPSNTWLINKSNEWINNIVIHHCVSVWVPVFCH